MEFRNIFRDLSDYFRFKPRILRTFYKNLLAIRVRLSACARIPKTISGLDWEIFCF